MRPRIRPNHAAIILAVVLPLGWTAYSAYDESTLRAYVESRLDALEGAARALSASPGGVRAFELDLSGSGSSDVDWMSLGGALGSGFDQIASYSVEGRTVRRALEGVRLASPENATLELDGAVYNLVMESKTDWQGRVFVEVGLVNA